jgi:anti-sigma factor RsiW
MSDLERDGRDLWRRYRAAASAFGPEPHREPDAGPGGGTGEPDFGLLAAWLDGRLDEAEAAPVEAWLARDPEALAALAAPAPEPGPAPLDLVRRARGLVAPGGGAGAASPPWRRAVAWASVAASLVLVGASGFMAGHDALDHHEEIASLMGGELIFGPGGGDGDGAAF